MRRAFTLIELLVVIAIIAILAAILFPVFAQAKEAAKKTATLSGMKQIGTALQMYQGDFDDGLPTWTSYWYDYYELEPKKTAKGLDTVDKYWDAKLYPYVKSGNPGKAANDTSAPNWAGVWKSLGNERDDTVRSIGISMGLIYDSIATSPTYYRYITGSELEASADTIFAGDSGTSGRLGRPSDQQGYFERWMCRENTPKPSGCPTAGHTRDAPWRFTDQATYVFCDGHAKAMKGDALFPRPPKNSSGNWVFASGVYAGNNDCSMAKYFAAKADQRQFHRDRALNTYGVTCK